MASPKALNKEMCNVKLRILWKSTSFETRVVHMIFQSMEFPIIQFILIPPIVVSYYHMKFVGRAISYPFQSMAGGIPGLLYVMRMLNIYTIYIILCLYILSIYNIYT